MLTPTETARTALLKAREALPDPPMPHIGEGFTRGAVIRLMQPARLAIEQALAALPAVEPPTASMDEKAAFEAWRVIEPWHIVASDFDPNDPADDSAASSYRLMNMAASKAWQAAVQWARSQDAKDAARYRIIESIIVDMGRCYEIPLEPGATLAETIDALDRNICTCHTYMTEGGPVTSGVFQCPVHKGEALAREQR